MTRMYKIHSFFNRTIKIVFMFFPIYSVFQLMVANECYLADFFTAHSPPICRTWILASSSPLCNRICTNVFMSDISYYICVHVRSGMCRCKRQEDVEAMRFYQAFPKCKALSFNLPALYTPFSNMYGQFYY